MDASTNPMMASNIDLAFPLPSRKHVLTAFSLNVFLWTFLTVPGISLVAKEPHRTCEGAEILQGVTGRRAVTGKMSSHPLSLFACQGRITYYEITLANDPTLSTWLEYSISANTHKGMHLTEKSEEFQLIVVAHGGVCEISTAKADVTLHDEDRICVHAKNIICFGDFSICSGGWYARHLSITFAEILLQTDSIPEITEQLKLICTMAEYLHLHASSLTLTPAGDSLNKYFRNLTVLAEGLRCINSTRSHHVGLYWPVGFGVFAMLSELVRVLSHNVESDHLSQLLGYEIVAWRVLKQGYEKRNPRKIWQKRKMATPKPTWRPSQMENFAVLIAAVPETRSVVKSEASSLLVNKTTFSVIHPYVDLSTQPLMVNVDLETLQVSKSTMFHYLTSELSPSLMLSSTEFEEKGTFETPPISEHLLYEPSLDISTQEDFPTTQKTEPKYNSTFYYFSLFMSMTKNHFSNSVDRPRDILSEEMPSTPSSPEFLSGELRNLSDHSPFMHRTTSGFKFGEIVSIIEFSLPSIEWLSYRSSWITTPLELAHTSSFHFSTSQCDSIHNVVRTLVLEPDALPLDTDDLSLESLFGTKTNVQITRDIVSKSKEEAIVFSRKGISVENGFHATTLYQKTQGQPNTPPRVIHAIKWIAATVGHEFSFLIPPETFHDQEDGDSTQLTLGMNPVDGSPTDLESWLQFNARDQSMYGYPLAVDFQYSPQEFVLFATDSGGLKTEDKFVVQILKPTIIPCHFYTVITTNSYHSFLKNRTRIHFFLKKVSNYLLAESPADVVLLHLKTGSTVFTWYNKSLCPKTEKCARDDIQDVLTKLGRPGKDVHPDFAEAMLPEFKIKQIREVGFAGICLFTTKPTNESVVFNRTVTGFNGDNCWITNALTALLIAVCSTILVLLIVVRCQKYHKKTFQPPCSPPCGHIDFKMDTPTLHQSPLLEQDVLPLTRLPLPLSIISQQRSFRPHRGLVVSRLPSPPKYRLPPLYGRRDPG